MKAGLLVRAAAVSAAIAVGAGAFAAHGAGPRAAELLRTGALYELTHAVAVVAIAQGRRRGLAGALLLGGSLLFAGTLYAMAFGAPRWLGAVTPVGGVAMIAGWVLLAVRV